MALVDLIKKETPQETAKRLAKEKADKTSAAIKTKVKVNINSSEADMVKKEAVKPTMVFKRGADISNLDETEQGYNANASDDSGNINSARIGYTLAGKSSEPANFSAVAPTTDAQYADLRNQFIPTMSGGGFSGTTKTLVDTAKAIGEAAQAMGVTDIETMRANFGVISKKAGVRPELIKEFGENGSSPFAEQMIHGGFNFIRGLKKSKAETFKKGGLVGVSDPEIIK